MGLVAVDDVIAFREDLTNAVFWNGVGCCGGGDYYPGGFKIYFYYTTKNSVILIFSLNKINFYEKNKQY